MTHSILSVNARVQTERRVFVRTDRGHVGHNDVRRRVRSLLSLPKVGSTHETGHQCRVDQQHRGDQVSEPMCVAVPTVDDVLSALKIGLGARCVGQRFLQSIGHLRGRGSAGRQFRLVHLDLRGFDRRARARDILAEIADFAGGVENEKEDWDKCEAPVAFQIKTVKTHESGAEPENIGNEQRNAARPSAFALSRDQVHGDERKADQRSPIEPVG